jgi:hypothetical protein
LDKIFTCCINLMLLFINYNQIFIDDIHVSNEHALGRNTNTPFSAFLQQTFAVALPLIIETSKSTCNFSSKVTMSAAARSNCNSGP